MNEGKSRLRMMNKCTGKNKLQKMYNSIARMREPIPQKGFRASLVQNFLRGWNPAYAPCRTFSFTHKFAPRLFRIKTFDDGYDVLFLVNIYFMLVEFRCGYAWSVRAAWKFRLTALSIRRKVLLYFSASVRPNPNRARYRYTVFVCC